MWRALLAHLCGSWLTMVTWAESPALLDIYFEESHAGTFYHWAQTLPLDEPHTLVLIDAHSDASAIAGSDHLREAIRKTPTEEARFDLFQHWRKEGAIQCYDWIEPLMPAPLTRVIWVPARQLHPIEVGRHQILARESLDGLQESFPRTDGALGARYEVKDWTAFEAERGQWTAESRVVVSLDLDFFAAIPEQELTAKFEQVFSGILQIPGLRALTFSLSSPWLKHRAQGEQLTALALEAATSVANARVSFAPGADAGPDRSRQAQALQRAGKRVPRLDLSAAGAGLRSLLLARRSRLNAEAKLSTLLDEWELDPFLPRAEIEGEIAEPDGWHRLRAEQAYRLRLKTSEDTRVRWYLLRPEAVSTNVAGLSLGFAEQAPRWLRRVPQFLGEGQAISSHALHPYLEPTTHAGTALVYAVIEREGEAIRSNELSLAFRISPSSPEDTFRGALSEQFARPYAFGCGLIPGGPPKLVASDCANFLIAALRRDGWRMPWMNPKQFAEYCEELGRWKKGDGWLPLEASATANGPFIHFGSHVAALWEDREPKGQLDPADLVAHHLEGYPEIVPLGKLLEKRDAFRLLKLKPQADTVRLVFGGDVMLGRRVGKAIDRKHDPLARLTPMLAAADLAIINLECVASPLGQPVPGQRFHFRAHSTAPDLLRQAGLDVVSLANNHARDFGNDAFHDATKRLETASLGVLSETPQPHVVRLGTLKLAFFACTETASDELLAAIQLAARDSFVIVMTHWGMEHSRSVSDAQRTLGAQLAGAGARLIVGSGPHTRQPLEFSHAALVAWSLGNLVFDGPGPDAAWSHGALLEVTLQRDGIIVRAREIPVRIDHDGTATPE